MRTLAFYDLCKRAAEQQLGAIVNGHGHAAAGVAIDAALAAAGEYLRFHHGAQVAFDTFTRAAERAIAPQLSKIPPTPDEATGR